MESRSTKIHIKKSKLHGKGLFSLRNIKKGEGLFVIKGKKIKFLITNKKKAKTAGVDWIGMGKNEWFDPENYYGSYFNHSCNPNAIIKNKIYVVAFRNIKEGEEITFDYSTNEADIFWNMNCRCGEKECRKVIKSIQFLPKKVFDKHKVHIPKYYKMIYNRYNHINFKNKKILEKVWVDFLKGKKNDRIKKK